MKLNKTGLYYVPPPVEPSGVDDDISRVMFSRMSTTEAIPGLGKNMFPIKIFIPERIKSDLQACADKAEIPLSTFVREILVSNILGHTLWPERVRGWSQEEEIIATDWEEGRLEPEVFYESGSELEQSLKGKTEITQL